MFSEYLSLNFSVKGKTFKGFCMRIQDSFHLTYAVVLDDCHSFAVWLDEKKAEWQFSKFAKVDQSVLDQIIHTLKFSEDTERIAVS